MKVTIDGFLHYDISAYKNEPEESKWKWHQYKAEGCNWLVTVKPLAITVEVPDNYDPRQQQVEAKREEIRKVEAEFSKRVMELKAELNNLLALEAS